MKFKRVLASLIISLKEFQRNKAVIFFVLLFPILLMVLFGFIFQGQGEVVYELTIQNLDGKEHSLSLIENLSWTGVFDIEVVDATTDIDQYISDNNLNTVLVIPETYSDTIDQLLMNQSAGPPVEVTIIYDPSNTAAITKVQVIHSMIGFVNQQLSGATAFVVAGTETAVSDDFNYIDFFAPGIIAMAVMTTALFGTVGMNTELRQKGVLRKLATTPLTRSEWLLSNILYQLCMASISTAAILVVGIGLFDLRPHFNLFLPLFIILNVFAFSGIGMLITRFVKEAESAQAAANAVMFPMMFLSGTFFPLEQMPDFLQVIAKFLPLYYVNEGLRAGMISLEMDTIMVSAFVIFMFAAIVFVLGIFLTSWKED